MVWMLAACMSAPEQPDFIAGPENVADVGAEAPDFTLEGAGGEAVTLSDDRGDVIFLDMSGFT